MATAIEPELDPNDTWGAWNYAVMRSSKATGTAYTVMLVLANYANHEGIASPGNQVLARDARLSVPTLIPILNKLIADGEIEKVSAPRKGHAAEIRILAGRPKPIERRLPTSEPATPSFDDGDDEDDPPPTQPNLITPRRLHNMRRGILRLPAVRIYMQGNPASSEDDVYDWLERVTNKAPNGSHPEQSIILLGADYRVRPATKDELPEPEGHAAI